MKMKMDIKTLAFMYGVSDIYTQLTVVREDTTTIWAAAGTFRHIAKTYPDCPLVSWGYFVEDGKGYISLVGKGW